MSSEVFGSPMAVALAITIVSAWMLIRRWRMQVLVSAVGGLHLNVFLFCGIGGVCLVNFGAPQGRLPHGVTLDYLPRIGFAFLAGYLIWIPAELWLARNLVHTEKWNVSGLHLGGVPFCCLFGLSLIGYFGSNYELATVSIGTIFPVMKGLFYPSIVLAIVGSSSKNTGSIILCCLVLLLAVYLGMTSGWRSELIMVSGSVSLALALKFPRALPTIGILLLIGVFLLLPLVDYKKRQYDKFQADPAGAFVQSLDMDLEERMTFVGQFFGVRVNSLREMIYVEHALEQRWADHRYGRTYLEAMQQLVPRVLWPGKPSFNQTTNYLLPRQIGLVGWEDPYTSWGVSLYAEFIWNFWYGNLVWFVPLAFAAFYSLDLATSRLLGNGTVSMIGKLSLFFLTFQIVGLVGAMTYIAWTLIVVKTLGIVLEGSRGLKSECIRDGLGSKGRFDRDRSFHGEVQAGIQ